MKFIADWKESWRWFSMQALALLAILPMVWVALPPDLKSHLPESWGPWVLFALAIGGGIGRLIDQKK